MCIDVLMAFYAVWTMVGGLLRGPSGGFRYNDTWALPLSSPSSSSAGAAGRFCQKGLDCAGGEEMHGMMTGPLYNIVIGGRMVVWPSHLSYSISGWFHDL